MDNTIYPLSLDMLTINQSMVERALKRTKFFSVPGIEGIPTGVLTEIGLQLIKILQHLTQACVDATPPTIIRVLGKSPAEASKTRLYKNQSMEADRTTVHTGESDRGCGCCHHSR